jgi:DUF4097 and DUF4098 domain-containing protein YvlB
MLSHNTRPTIHPSLRSALAAAVLATLALSVSAHRVEKHFTVEGRPVVTIHNSNGRIQVKSWNKAEVMFVADHATANVEVESEQVDSRIEIGTRVLNASARSVDLQADYTVTVPEETELQIRTDSGSITVASVHGNLTFDTLAADVNLQDVGGVVMVTTADGSIVCSRCDGSSFKAETVGGNVQILQPVMDKITVHTTAGNILFDGDFLRHGLYVLKSDTGNTEVRYGSASSFDLMATSVRGSVLSQVSFQPDKHGRKDNPPKYGKSLFGTVGKGNAKVELYSFSGTIKIMVRDSVAP